MLVRKLLRDLACHPGQALLLALVFALGVAAFHGVRAAYTGLMPTTAALYRRLALPDLVASVAFAPAQVVAEVAALPGVAAVEGRTALDTAAEGHAGVTVRVVSLPAPAQPRLGRVELTRGRPLSGAPGELLLAEGAARYHGLEPGDTLRLKDAEGETVAFEVVGLARQPEHLSMIPPGGFMAMPRSFMVVLLPEASAARLLGRRGGVTELALELAPGADEEAVIAALRERLGRYRLTVTRSDNLPSVRNIRVHLEALGGAALVFPLLFLTAGALGGFILLSRVVRQERGLVGLLRATGYGPVAVGLHYLGYTLVLAGLGAAAGVPLGLPLARFVRRIFAADLGTPVSGGLWQPEIALLAAGAAALSGALAGLTPAWAAAHLPPAEAMRPAAPPSGRAFGWLRLARVRAAGLRMSLRNLLRRPVRTLLGTLGVTLAVTLALAPALILKETNRVEARVQAVRRYDLRVVPRLPQPERWLENLRNLPGVTRVEGLLELPVDLTVEGETLRTYALGLGEDSELLTLPTPPPERALLARGLPEATGPVRLRGPLGQLELAVDGQVNYPLGRPVVLSLADAQRLLTPPAALTGLMQTLLGVSLPGLETPVTAALLAADPARRSEVMTALGARAEIARLDDREVEREDLERVFRLTRAFIGVIEGFALLLGVALVYNTVVVNAQERRRELATLRVLGFTRGEVGCLFVLEALGTALVGIVPAVPLALWTAQVAMRDFRDFLPVGVGLYGDVLAWVALGVVLTVLLAAWPVVRDLGRLNLAEVVRERD